MVEFTRPRCGGCDIPTSLDAVQGFARREFQLMLLRRMADFQPDLVAAAHEEMGVTRKQYLAAHNRWQSMLRSKAAPRGLELYKAVLGPADARREEPYGDITLTAYSWRLPALWPELQWETLVGVDGAVLNGWLVRGSRYAPVDLPPPAEMAPWSCVVADVPSRYPQARQSDPQVPSQWLVEVDDSRLIFVHGLLQRVDFQRVD
jgi:hypothetical protein